MRECFVSGTVQGTTTATAVTVANIDTRGTMPTGKLTLAIKNLHASNTMYYQINGYLFDVNGVAGLPVVLKAQTSVGAATQIADTSSVTIPYACVQIQVLNNTGACPFEIDWVSA